MSAPDLLAVASAREGSPEGPVLVGRGVSYTLAGLEAVVGPRAQRLREAGAREGVVFPLVVEADEAGVIDLLALWRVGAVPAPLNPRLTPRERAQAESALLGADAGGAFVVLWTSGTEGRPRGVRLSFENMAGSARAAQLRLGLLESDVWLASLSPAHVGGLAIVARVFLLGGTLVAFGGVGIGEISDLIDAGVGPVGDASTTVSHLSLVPTQLSRLLAHREGRPPPASLRCALLGGAGTPSPLLERALAEGWPVALTYGMTEMASQVATAAPADVRRKPGSVGRALDGVEVSIASGGEILVRGPTQALGYLAAGPGSEAERIRLGDADGWHHSGDLGHIDPEGDLWVTGRRSDRIVSGGVTVDAAEVEQVLRSHPRVKDVCVVGVPDAEWGEVVGAWVVPADGSFSPSVADSWLRERLAGPKRPRRWVIEPQIPLNANGKVDRNLVRDRLTG